MQPNEHHESESQQNKDRDHASSAENPPVIVSTSDPNIEVGHHRDDPPAHPDETIVAETSQVTHDVPIKVHVANVPIEHEKKQEPKKNQDKTKNQDNMDKDAKNQQKPDEKKDDKKDESKNQNKSEHPNRSRWIGLALTCVLSLACGLAGAWAYNHFEGKDKDKDQSKGGSHAGKGKNDSDSSSKKDDSSNSQAKNDDGDDQNSKDHGQKKPEVTKKDLDDLKGQIDAMSGKVTAIQERFDSFAGLRNDRGRDISELQVKIKEISHSVAEVADIPRRMQPLEERMNRLQVTVDGLSFQLAGRETIRPIAEFPRVGDEKNKVVATGASGPILAAPMVPASPNLPDATMTAAISFFKKAQYIQADQIFTDLQISQAGDARVWYYSALAHGLATGKWDGETKRFVSNGADRESAGSPPSSQIDAMFADLTVEQGKDWLAAYRARLVKH